MASANRLSILVNASKSSLVLEPYPHLVIENALDPALFKELQDSFPSDETVVNGRKIADTWFDYPACKVIKDSSITPLWQDFFRHHTSQDFFHELVDIAGDALLQLNPDLEKRIGRSMRDFKVAMRPGGRQDTLAPGADISMECQFYVNYSKALRTVRGPHIDRPSELFAALLYFRQPEDHSTGGDLEICKGNDSLYPDRNTVKVSELPAEIDTSQVHQVKTAQYKENTLVLFLNSPKSIHAVSPRTPTQLTRRHINFCCDVPFDLFKIKPPLKLEVKRKLMSLPFGWRLAKYIH